MKKTLIPLLTVTLAASRVLAAEGESPWWKQEKMRFMWGQWCHARLDKEDLTYDATLPRELFRNIARAGCTVFAELEGYNPDHARYAHEFGVRYFASRFISFLRRFPCERPAITETGEKSAWTCPHCPLDESIYDEKWLVGPLLEGARQGLIDGVHIDWENYGGAAEPGVCYCDDCFAVFLERQGLEEPLPEKTERSALLKDRGLVAAYEENYSRRRVAMFTRIREKLQAANPNLLFSSYGVHFSDFTRAMNTPETPFIYLDLRHYWNDDRQAWWESYGPRLRREGYLYLPGGWTNALFGAQASQVSAARWIYEASINEDGCWVWFERELDDEILRAYAAADRALNTAQGKVGQYLFGGTRDPNFATAVEWTGRPELARAVIARSYHLGDEHLTHVNNVHSEWPLRTRIRFPRLPGTRRWTVRDPMSEFYYTRDGTSPAWTSADLLAGVVVAMEPRSDLFLLLSPADGDLRAAGPVPLMHSRDFSVLPEHAAASAEAGPVKRMILLYRMKNSIYGEKLDALLASTQKIIDLPNDGWHIKKDEKDIGASDGWFRPQRPLDDWTPAKIGAFWKAGTGAGWYRADVDIPELPAGKRIYLHFGAVDEHLVLWIDGEYAGDYDREPGEGWDKPFAIDVTGKLTAGRHHLALRVYNVTAAGGVWKPVSVLAGPAVAGAGPVTTVESDAAREPSGRLVYTTSEPMGFGGAEGGLTIGNAIRTAAADGGNQLRIRQLRGHLWSPCYSPDGERIAFVHDAGGRGQIHVIDADGSDVRNISDNAFCDRTPTWSPDGRTIAFISDRTGDWDIYTMSADGSGQRRVAGNAGLDRSPAWSPDGTRLAWESHVAGMPNIWICDADGGNAHLVIEPDKPLSIQHTIERLSHMVPKPIFPDKALYLIDPVWSPDGERIAAVSVEEIFDGGGLVVLRADGSGLLQVNNWLAAPRNPVWSPDGTRLAATHRCASHGESETAGVFVVNVDGKEERRLVNVSPQGPRIGGARRHGLLTWYSHGSAQPRRVVKTFTSLAWSPDGTTLAFSSDMDPSGAFYVYTIDPAGGEPTRLDLSKSAWPNQIMWQPR